MKHIFDVMRRRVSHNMLIWIISIATFQLPRSEIPPHKEQWFINLIQCVYWLAFSAYGHLVSFLMAYHKILYSHVCWTRYHAAEKGEAMQVSGGHLNDEHIPVFMSKIDRLISLRLWLPNYTVRDHCDLRDSSGRVLEAAAAAGTITPGRVCGAVRGHAFIIQLASLNVSYKFQRPVKKRV